MHITLTILNQLLSLLLDDSDDEFYYELSEDLGDDKSMDGSMCSGTTTNTKSTINSTSKSSQIGFRRQLTCTVIIYDSSFNSYISYIIILKIIAVVCSYRYIMYTALLASILYVTRI